MWGYITALGDATCITNAFDKTDLNLLRCHLMALVVICVVDGTLDLKGV